MLKDIVNISTFLTFSLAFILGVVTLYRNSKTRVNQTWALLCLATMLWSGGYLIGTNATNVSTMNFWLKVIYPGIIFIPIFTLHFTVSFLRLNKKKKYFIWLGYSLAVISLILFYTTDSIIKGSSYTEGFGFHEDPGKYFIIFLIYFFFFAIYSIYLLFRAYPKNDGLIRKQIFYIIIAMIIAYVTSGTNYLVGTLGIFPYGQMIVFLYPVIITYAIFLKKY